VRRITCLDTAVIEGHTDVVEELLLVGVCFVCCVVLLLLLLCVCMCVWVCLCGGD